MFAPPPGELAPPPRGIPGSATESDTDNDAAEPQPSTSGSCVNKKAKNKEENIVNVLNEQQLYFICIKTFLFL